MPTPKVSDQEFKALWETYGSLTRISEITGLGIRGLNKRRRNLEERYGELLVTSGQRIVSREHPARKLLGIENGTVIVFSDAHFWPGIRSTAFDGLLHLIKELQPKAVICNGDAFDGSTSGRWPRIGWTQNPTLVEELKACKEALGEIEDAAKAARHNVKLTFPLGNHDARFENYISANAPLLEGVQGSRLSDHVPAWDICWSCWPTNDVVVKHRWKSGIHATHNNTLNSGVSIVTGHLHALKVTGFTDYNGRRFGVDTGCLSEIDGPQFYNYTEDNPTNWASGFAVLTFHNGRLLYPELVHKFDKDHIEFRGQIIKVR